MIFFREDYKGFMWGIVDNIEQKLWILYALLKNIRFRSGGSKRRICQNLFRFCPLCEGALAWCHYYQFMTFCGPWWGITAHSPMSLILTWSECQCLLAECLLNSLLSCPTQQNLSWAQPSGLPCCACRSGSSQEERVFPYTHPQGSLSVLCAPHPSCLGIFKQHLLLLFYRDNVYLNFRTCLPFYLFTVSSCDSDCPYVIFLLQAHP